MTQPMTITTTAPSPAAPAAPAAAPTAPAQVPAAAPAAPEAAAAPVETTIGDAPAPAPVAAAPAQEPESKGDAGPVTYEPTGDAGLDLALGFLGKLGIEPSDPAMVQAESGDFALLRAKLALMGDKAEGYEQVLAVGEAGYKAIQAARAAEAQKTTDAILSVFGEDKEKAAEQWNKVREWAKANAEPHERDAVNTALKAGGIAAKAMAAYLGQLYIGHPSAEIEPAAVTNIGGRAATTNGALSPAEYKGEIAKLQAKLGSKMDGSPEYKALQARRLAWRG